VKLLAPGPRLLIRLCVFVFQPRQESTERPDAAVALELARSIEKEMWNMFERQTNSAYKAKFRTLLFNLKDERNQVLPQPTNQLPRSESF